MAKPAAKSGSKSAKAKQAAERKAEAARQEAVRREQRQRTVLEALTAGALLDTALAYAGVDAIEYGEWLERDESFATQARKIEADFELLNLAVIGKAARTDWRAADRLLRLRFPDRYARGGFNDAGAKDGPGALERRNCTSCGTVLSADTADDECRLCSGGGGLRVVG